MLLDACCTLAADYAFVHWVIAVAINISNLAIFQMHFDAATAGAHVASGCFDLVPIFGAGVDLWLGEDSHKETLAKHCEAHYGPYYSCLLGQHLASFQSGTMVEPILGIGL